MPLLARQLIYQVQHMTTDPVTAFTQLALTDAVFKALDEVGYETPTAIQARTIPLLLEGRDILGQAQTGTGKTAAFALPILSSLDLKQKDPQVLVLAPTRELAIQVAEAFQKYAMHILGFHVLPVYGGQDYRGQIRALQRGVHVVVGTPGRVMDHMRRGTLKLGHLKTLVLDEADEMLRMGFIDDVEWILEQTPPTRQIALFSATLPKPIRRIAAKYLNNPAEITIKVKTTTADTIRQRFWPVSGTHKLDALTRILEAETFDAMLVFVRTRIATTEVSEKLEARGYASAALNGEIPQSQRERTVEMLKKGKLDILVATDVAARGLDLDRVTHVINYDIPHDTEAYVHRIGRTGRAGRQGDAILFVAPRETRMLAAIEKATRQKIDLMELPSTELINDKRIARFKQRITDTLSTDNLGLFPQLIEQYQQEHNVTAIEVAAALAKMLQGDTPFLYQAKPVRKSDSDKHREERARTRKSDRPARTVAAKSASAKTGAAKPAAKAGKGKPESPKSAGGKHKAVAEPEKQRKPGTGPGSDMGSESDEGTNRLNRKLALPAAEMERFRVEVGRNHEVKAANIVGAIANEAGLEGQYIGQVEIYDDYSLVDLPQGMPRDIFNDLKKVWVSGQQLKISRLNRETGNKRKQSDKQKDVRRDKSTGKPVSRKGPRKRKPEQKG